MEVIHERCAGLDVHREVVVGCVRVRERGRVRREVRRWATTTAELLKLADWLRKAGCTHVAMEATGSTGSRCGTCWKVSSNYFWLIRHIFVTCLGAKAISMTRLGPWVGVTIIRRPQ
jgi:hypothetical protein